MVMVLGYNDLVHDGVWMMPHLFRSLCLALIRCGRNLRGLKVQTFLDSLEDGTEDDPNLFKRLVVGGDDIVENTTDIIQDKDC